MDISRYRRILMHDPPWKCILELLEPSNIVPSPSGKRRTPWTWCISGRPLAWCTIYEKRSQDVCSDTVLCQSKREWRKNEERYGDENRDDDGTSMVKGLLCVTLLTARLNEVFPSLYLVNNSAQFSIVPAFVFLRLHASLSSNKKSKEEGGKVKGYRNKHECLKKDECFGRLKNTLDHWATREQATKRKRLIERS